MFGVVNRLQLMLFHYMFAFEIMKERAEDADKQVEHLAKILEKILTNADKLQKALDRLDLGTQPVE